VLEAVAQLVQDAAAFTHAVTPLYCWHLGTLHATAQQSVPYMHRWSNIARSHKTKTVVPVEQLIITINLSGKWQGVLLKKIIPTQP
jgi:hypothetical protein